MVDQAATPAVMEVPVAAPAAAEAAAPMIGWSGSIRVQDPLLGKKTEMPLPPLFKLFTHVGLLVFWRVLGESEFPVLLRVSEIRNPQELNYGRRPFSGSGAPPSTDFGSAAEGRRTDGGIEGRWQWR